MNKRCILHYGMPKTGSSSIQTWLLQALDDPRYLYLNLGRRGSGNIMVSAFLEKPEAHYRNLRRGVEGEDLRAEMRSIREQMVLQLSTLGSRTALFSAELLASIRPPELQSIASLLSNHCQELHAVGYVRSPVSFMESVYQQRLKAGNPGLDLRKIYPRYRMRLKKFEAQLGAAHVEYWHFDPRSFVKGCVVRDFCQRIGIVFAGEDVARVNDSLSLRAIRLLYAYRQFGPGYGKGEGAMKENRALIQRLLQLPGPKLRLHRDAVAPTLAEYRDDIAWMEARLGKSLAESISSDDDDVRDESDLLRFDAESLDWMAAQADIRPLSPTATAAQVADQMQQLRERLSLRKASP
jgi:hypothetical protein